MQHPLTQRAAPLTAACTLNQMPSHSPCRLLTTGGILQEMDPSGSASLYCGSCTRCSKAVCGAGRVCQVLQARGKSFPPSCFCCVVCRQSLEGRPLTVDSDSRVHCVSDDHRVQAPRCAACRMPILPTEESAESIRVESLQ